jgi:hypothetical protein
MKARKASKAIMIEDIKYNAKWDDKPGDFVEVFHPSDKRSRMVGQIEYLYTKKSDGLYPCHGKLILVRQFEGLELEFETSSIVRRVDGAEWKKLLKQIKEKLPKSLEVYHQYKNDNGDIVRSKVDEETAYRLDAEVVSRGDIQISVDVLDETGAILVENDKDKTRVVQTRKLIVELELFNSHGDKMRDPKSRQPWIERLSPFQVNESRQFNTGSGTRHFTPLATMLQQYLAKGSNSFQMGISLAYDTKDGADHPYRTDLLTKIESVKCLRKFEILAGELE